VQILYQLQTHTGSALDNPVKCRCVWICGWANV